MTAETITWIDAKEREPDHAEDVLAIVEPCRLDRLSPHRVVPAYLSAPGDWRYAASGHRIDDPVTWWAEMPRGPRGEA